MPDRHAREHIDFGPFQLEIDPGRLRRGQEEIELGPKSLGVLLYLARHPGRLVSKDELREHVWGATHVSDTRLRVTVGEIRAALGDSPKSPGYLETVPARGYRFLAGLPENAEPEDGKGAQPQRPLLSEQKAIVGREREVEQLLNRFLAAQRGRRQIVFLGGEPGVGKSTLVGLLLERLAGRAGTACAVGQCVRSYGAGEAYGPVLEALGRLGGGAEGEALVRVLERCAPMWLVQLPALVDDARLDRLQRRVMGATQERMVRELADFLERWTAEKTLVLVLEDVHWSDLATVELLAAVAQRPEPARLLILCTYRPAEAVIHAPALGRMMRDLGGRGQCEKLGLELLERQHVAAYLAARLGGAISDALADLVFERSGGNALFMENVLDHLAQAIGQSGGRWGVAEPAAALGALPEGLRPFLQRRAEALSDDEHEVLEAASVVGVELAATAVAAALAPRDVESVEACLDGLVVRTPMIERAGAVEWPDGTLSQGYRFRHGLYQEGLYGRIPASRRARLHGLVGERLSSAFGGQSADLAAVLAVHFEQSRDAENAARYRRLAGERALGRHAYLQAIEHLRSALEAHAKRPGRGRAPAGREVDAAPPADDWLTWELEVCMELGASLIATRGYADAEAKEIYLQAQALAEQLADPAWTFQAGYNLWIFALVAGELRLARRLAAELSELTNRSNDEELQLMAASSRAQTACWRGELADAAEAVRQALALYDPQRHRDLSLRFGQDDPGVNCRGLDAVCLWLAGSSDQAGEVQREILELGERLEHPTSLALALAYAQLAAQLLADEAEVSRRADELEALATEQGYGHWVAWAAIFGGWALSDAEAGAARMQRGIAAWRQTGSELLVPYFLGLLAETQLTLGRREAAQSLVSEAMALVEASGERWWQAELHRLAGEVQLAEGEKAAAEASFRRAIEVARKQGAVSLELRAAASLSRLESQSSPT